MPAKTAKKKTPRRQLSVERVIALALVEVIEAYSLPGDISAEPLDEAIANAKAVLLDQGFAGLESIPSRVTKIKTQIQQATDSGDYRHLARLSIELGRAQRGLSPIGKAAAPKVKKEPDAPADKAEGATA